MDVPSILPDLNPSSNGAVGKPYFSSDFYKKTICIIGAGPAGLAALKTALDSEQFKAGNWIPVAFEAREEVGGIWFPAPPDTTDPPLTPLYDTLTTNIPHPVMAYGSRLFPPETPLFPVAERVHDYLKEFSYHFSLRPHIKFSTRITSVTYTPDKLRRWLIQTGTDESYYFDLIMICNGHYRIPRYPSLPGLSEWQTAQKVFHSVYYRHPLPVYKDKTLLVVGSGPSGRDLTLDLNGYASKIIFSGADFETSIDPNGVHLRPYLTSFGSPAIGNVTFADGTVDEGIDYCILATGYILDFPFLQPPLIRKEYPKPIPPLPKDLYNSSYSAFALAQQLWPLQAHYPPETIAFLGLPVRVSPFPLIEAQARATLRAFDTYEKGVESGSGMRGIDEQAEAVDIVTRWEKLKVKRGEAQVVKIWHRFEEPEQFEYRDHLSIFSENDSLGPSSETTQPNSNNMPNAPSITQAPVNALKQVIRVQNWERWGYAHKDILRRTWVKIEKNGEAEKWLKGVGVNGVDDWIDFMHRMVAYGEELEKGDDDEKARL
ncbi:Flavin-containing monooxygenase FMO GS-OX-like 9 [Leucoagaricus sp. SymC.cos]|nr:Flavin-containing monooxygenase FMO GS-OX-like 9 [Leucoagaricus sp. SymC.cos]